MTPKSSLNNYDPSEPNSGHGHVFRRPDRNVARCGGPSICSVCKADVELKNRRLVDLVVEELDAYRFSDEKHVRPAEGLAKRIIGRLKQEGML